MVCKEVWKVSGKDYPGFVSYNKITGLCSISFKFHTYINRSQAFLLCFVLFVCFALSSLNYLLSIFSNRELHWWFSGRILACHAGGPGSIPGQCIFLIACTILNIYKILFWNWKCERRYDTETLFDFTSTNKFILTTSQTREVLKQYPSGSNKKNAMLKKKINRIITN